MATPESALQKKLMAMLERRHPDYERLFGHWNFLEAAYEGGLAWFTQGNIFQYFKEGDQEYKKRVARAYRFNHTREVVDLVQKYIFKPKIVRNQTDAPAEIQDFWLEVTREGLDVDQFMKLVSTESSKLGMMWICVDTTKTAKVISVADEKAVKARCYAYTIKPQDVLDMGFDKEGKLLWILVREIRREDEDPIEASGACYQQFRLWDREGWRLFEIVEEEPTGKAKKGRKIVELIDAGAHNLGRVPLFPVTHVVCGNRYSAPGLIDDIAYQDRAIANYLSNLDAIIQDQTFSQLTIPAQALLPGSDEYNQLVEMGTKRVFAYDGEGGAKPDFISPDPRQAGVIITVINKIINEIYHTIGMAGERTKQDNAMGIDNSSGVAKAYDFERMNSLLTSKAASLENAENMLVELVMLWHGKPEVKEELVKYPDTFDVRSLFDEFTLADRLRLIEAPESVRREQMKQVIDKLFPRLAADLRAKMEAELEEWPLPAEFEVNEVAVAGGATKPSKFPTSVTLTRKGGAAGQNRQGQVTSETGKKP